MLKKQMHKSKLIKIFKSRQPFYYQAVAC